MSDIIKDLSGSNIRISNYYTDKNIYTNIYLVSPNTDDSYTTKPPLISLPNLDDKNKQNDQHTKLLNMSFHLLKTWEPFYDVSYPKNAVIKNINYLINPKKDLIDISKMKNNIINTANIFTHYKTLFDKDTIKEIESLNKNTIEIPNDGSILKESEIHTHYIKLLSDLVGKINGTQPQLIDLKESIRNINEKLELIIPESKTK